MVKLSSYLAQNGEALPAEKSAQKTKLTAPIGEVLSASITGLTAEARQEEGADGLPETIRPGFGSFVKADSTEQNLNIIGVVYDVVTGPQDSSHRPAALGMTREQLKLEQPHIFSLLRTEIHAVTIGYFRNKRYYHHLPPHPAQVHDFLYLCSPEEIRAVTEDMDFLRLIAAVPTVPSDELLSAAIRQACIARGNEYQFLVTAGQALSHLFRDDYDRLLSVLKKLKPN